MKKFLDFLIRLQDRIVNSHDAFCLRVEKAAMKTGRTTMRFGAPVPSALCVTLFLFVALCGPLEAALTERDARITAEAAAKAEVVRYFERNTLNLEKERVCLAKNVYHEARNQSIEGQLAVARVTLNRVNSDLFPDTVCGVVHQWETGELNDCQFSWYCDGKPDAPLEQETYRKILAFSNTTFSMWLDGHLGDPVNGAHSYFAEYLLEGDETVPNAYFKGKCFLLKVGVHKFYGEKNNPYCTTDPDEVTKLASS